MLAKIKIYGLIVLGALAMALFAALQISERRRVAFQASVSKKTQEIRDKAHKANLRGAVDEHEAMTRPLPRNDEDDGF